MIRKRIGSIGVDAGLMYLGDPCYVIDSELGRMAWLAFLDQHCPNPDKDQWTKVVGHPRSGAAIGVTVVTGDGDGVYPVDVEFDKDGRPRKLTITFTSR